MIAYTTDLDFHMITGYSRCCWRLLLLNFVGVSVFIRFIFGRSKGVSHGLWYRHEL